MFFLKKCAHRKWHPSLQKVPTAMNELRHFMYAASASQAICSRHALRCSRHLAFVYCFWAFTVTRALNALEGKWRQCNSLINGFKIASVVLPRFFLLQTVHIRTMIIH